MEHKPDPSMAENGESAERQYAEDPPDGCGKFILKFIGGAIVLLIVVIALVFGVCLLG